MDNYNEQESNIVVAVDIGTTKVCAIAGRRNQYGKIEVLAVSKVESEGVTRGVVANIEKTSKAISEVIDSIQNRLSIRVKSVYVGIAGQHIKSVQHRGILTRENAHNEIGEKDIEKLINDMYRLVLPPGDKILHVYPQEFTVDNEPGIVDPIGMSGVRLEANFHIVTTQDTACSNLKRCFERVGLEVEEVILEPVASSFAVLTDEEMEAGVALIDIGGGTTDLTIFYDGILRHTAVIPFGGNVVTKDIKEGCTVMHQQAEKLKVKFGSALSDEVLPNRIITIPGFKGRDNKEISEKNLSLIIQARVEEIFDYALSEIRRSGFEDKLIGGLVLTGGGSMLKNIDNLAEFHTGVQTRIGHPIENLAHGFSPNLSNPIYSTSIGLLIYGLNKAKASTVIHIEQAKDPSVATGDFPPLEIETTNDSGWFRSASKSSKSKGTNPPKQETVVKERSGTKGHKLGDYFETLFNKTKDWFEASPENEFK
jgi:cell division protein FtsA